MPEWLRYELAADLETELLRDENLSAANRTLASFSVRLSPGQREFSVSQTGLEDPTFVSVTFDGSPDTVPDPVNITNAALIDSEARDGRRSVAFFSDKPQRGMVSWVPAGNETLRIWYDKSPATDPNPDQATFTITDSYVPLLKLLLAAQMLELTKQPIGDMLKSRIARGLKQWEKFVRSGKQIGVIQKTPWRPGRYGRSASQWDAWPGRVAIE